MYFQETVAAHFGVMPAVMDFAVFVFVPANDSACVQGSMTPGTEKNTSGKIEVHICGITVTVPHWVMNREFLRTSAPFAFAAS